MNIIEEAKRVFEIEIDALQKVQDNLDSNFENIVNLIKNCSGKIIITGMGKPGHIGRKIAATMASLGTSSFFLHPAEALHGDLGMISKDDIVLAISNSGESEEIVRILPNIKLIGATIVALTSNKDSTLIKYGDYAFVFPKFKEACPLNLAPTSSTTAELVFGDALAVVLAKLYGFNENNYALYHPAGSLGKRLLVKVCDIMHTGESNSVIYTGNLLMNAIVELSSKALSIVNIVDNTMNLLGVVTDGDIRRLLEKEISIYDVQVDNIMTKAPICIYEDALAIDALKLMEERGKQIAALPVLNNVGKLVGTVRIHDIYKAGIIV